MNINSHNFPLYIFFSRIANQILGVLENYHVGHILLQESLTLIQEFEKFWQKIETNLEIEMKFENGDEIHIGLVVAVHWKSWHNIKSKVYATQLESIWKQFY